MRDLLPSDVLDAVVEITEERDCERFRHSLCGTIREMLPVESIAFIRPVHGVGGEIFYQELYREARREHGAGLASPVQLPDAVLSPERVLAMVHAGHDLAIQDGLATLMLPVFHREALVEVMVVRAPAVSENAVTILKGYTRLFRNFRALIVESERDALTGLLNRRTLDSRLGNVLREAHERHASGAWMHAERRHEGVGDYIAVLDIDHFKRINDTLGHLFGDEVLILVSRLMRETFRDEDVLFRFGGEEFVVILLAHSHTAARTALERFRERVASHKFPQLDRVTVSSGFAALHAGDVPSTAVGRADQALYHSKEHGRNRVSYYEDLVACGEVKEAVQAGSIDLF